MLFTTVSEGVSESKRIEFETHIGFTVNSIGCKERINGVDKFETGFGHRKKQKSKNMNSMFLSPLVILEKVSLY